MNNNQIVPKDPQDEKILYPEFNKLKESNRELKTLLSIGGWNFGTSRFTTMLSTFANREKFVNSVIALLRTHGFDGLDLFFLYPGLRGSPRRDRWTFVFLLEELLLAFRKEAQLTIRPRLLLSAAVSGDPRVIQKAYDVHLLGRLLDFISVLSYDLHGSWEKFTGHNSPLFSMPKDPKSSICSFIWTAKKRWIDNQYVPYAYKGKEWVGYDDAVSFSYKAFFIMREHFGGAMVWTLDLDDVRGTFCGTGPFPLVYTLNNLLVKAEFSSTPPPKFWLSTAVNSSTIGPERLTVIKDLTTDLGILPPGGEAVATETHRKSETMTTVPRGGLVTPTRETLSFGKHPLALEWKTETPGEETMTPVGHQAVTPGGITVAPMHLQTEEKIMPPIRKAEAPEKMTIPSGKMTVTPAGQTETLERRI
ncbi:oviduct-specific glycoprotein isoform X4 [Kogia breviceps]|uniref:oviduct-specific glycoprotein isoform X4 n=1 Tax=Kogia breviceps TaxID=27615 RepID=UPI0034D36B0B